MSKLFILNYRKQRPPKGLGFADGTTILIRVSGRDLTNMSTTSFPRLIILKTKRITQFTRSTASKLSKLCIRILSKLLDTNMQETIIISLGGSLIVPDQIDIDFLKSFKTLILEHVAEGKKFVITTGGGKVNRTYNEAAKKITNPSDVDLDWIGIAALKLNAELLRVIFSEYAHEEVIANLSTRFPSNKPITIGSAYEPGHSSDYDAILAATSLGAKKLINLSNINYVYDSDPCTNPSAKKIEQISWADYRALIPKEWTARLNSPFDPTAAEAAEKEGIEVVIMNGKNISNLKKCLNGEKFLGTVIS